MTERLHSAGESEKSWLEKNKKWVGILAFATIGAILIL